MNEESEYTESESEEEYNLFQLEVVSAQEVYVCNICNEGLDSEYEVKEHLKEAHCKVFFNLKRKGMYEYGKF